MVISRNSGFPTTMAFVLVMADHQGPVEPPSAYPGRSQEGVPSYGSSSVTAEDRRDPGGVRLAMRGVVVAILGPEEW